MSDFAKLFKPNPFAGDRGEISPALAAAFAEPVANRLEAVVNQLGRVLIAAFAHAKPELDHSGKVQEHDSAGDPLADYDALFRGEFFGGQKAIEIFSDAQSLQQIYPQARPVPVSSRDIACVALTRGEGLLVLNPHCENMYYLGRSAVAALATQTPWIAPAKDTRIVSEIRDGIALIDASFQELLTGLNVIGIDHGVNVLDVEIARDTVAADAQELVRAIIVTIQENPYLRARLDALEIRPRFAARAQDL